MFCDSCGKEIEPNAALCQYCGNKIPAPIPITAGPYPQPIPSASQYPPQRRSGASTRKIVLAAAIIIIAVASLGAYGYLNRNSNSQNNSGNGGNGNGGTGPGNLQSSMNFAQWKGNDAHENNRFAFAMLIPKDWTAQGGVQRYQYPFGGADFNFTAKDPTGKSSIFFAVNDFPNIIEPSWFAGSFQQCVSSDLTRILPCGEDTWWLPANYIGLKAYVLSYMTASQYLQKYSANQMGFVPWLREHPALESIVNIVHPDVTLVKTVDNPNLRNRIIDVTSNEWSGADGLFTYTQDGQTYKELVQMLLGRLTITFQAYTFSEWFTSYWGYSAPQQDFNATGNIYSLVMPTGRVDRQWLTDEIARQAQASTLITHHLQNMQQLQWSMINSLRESERSTGQGWIDALGGSQPAYNPSDPSNIYKVSLDYTYWYDCNNYLIGTNVANFHTSCTSMTLGNPPGT